MREPRATSSPRGNSREATRERLIASSIPLRRRSDLIDSLGSTERTREPPRVP